VKIVLAVFDNRTRPGSRSNGSRCIGDDQKR
jgi:hypothetical protein